MLLRSVVAKDLCILCVQHVINKDQLAGRRTRKLLTLHILALVSWSSLNKLRAIVTAYELLFSCLLVQQ
jgi:hypothetical protein